MDTRKEIGTNGHHGTEERDAYGDRNPLTGCHEAGRKSFMGISDCRGGSDGRGDNGSDVAEEADEQRRDEQPQPDRLSAEQDHRRSKAALDQQCHQKDCVRTTPCYNSAGDDAGSH